MERDIEYIDDFFKQLVEKEPTGKYLGVVEHWVRLREELEEEYES